MSPSRVVNTQYCNASSLATNNPYSVQIDDSATAVHADLTERGFDIAPVYDEDNPQGFVRRDALKNVSEESKVREYVTTIELKHLIAPGADFETVLNALYHRPQYFIASNNAITGILTRADINTTPARQHLFTHITMFEQNTRELIQSQFPEWKDSVSLHRDVINEIESRHSDAKRNNIDLPEIHYAKISTIVDIILESEDCWRACGYEREGQAEDKLKSINKVRNDVAHANPIVQNTEENGIVPGRTTGKLLDIYQEIRKINAELGN